MHWAVLGKRLEVLRFLLGKRAWAEGADGADDTPLHLAARRVLHLPPSAPCRASPVRLHVGFDSLQCCAASRCFTWRGRCMAEESHKIANIRAWNASFEGVSAVVIGRQAVRVV